MTVFEQKQNFVNALVLEAIASRNPTDGALAAAAEDAFEEWKGYTPIDEAMKEIAS